MEKLFILITILLLSGCTMVCDVKEICVEHNIKPNIATKEIEPYFDENGYLVKEKAVQVRCEDSCYASSTVFVCR